MVRAAGISMEKAGEVLSAPTALARELDEEMALAQSSGAEIVTLNHPLYPGILLESSDPPPVLYCKGRLELLGRPSVAVVGTRRATDYGLAAAEAFSKELAAAGVTVVSGLAAGIDSAAHRAALDGPGGTLAVLGGGLARVYPRENVRLAEKIGERGLLVSEFSMSRGPERHHFPRRNRIIAGLSLGVLVAEAPEISGAMITARLAAEEGREVFALPGPYRSQRSAGPHRLIREGASLVRSVDDILKEIFSLLNRFHPGVMIHLAGPAGPAGGAGAPAAFAPEEAAVLEGLDHAPVHIDRIASRSRMGPGEISRALLELEMKGAVRAMPGKMYART
ncbi:MAG: DNA protecting protein DprA [Elusimicrobia bacterium RIFCSPHIGHO2_01_FULL_64_10]|nr:MAG: DNA protecting protein DprA [Elusimicrobia bacterium RIFCSPHIGHO2_01_FULL_64_10]